MRKTAVLLVFVLACGLASPDEGSQLAEEVDKRVERVAEVIGEAMIEEGQAVAKGDIDAVNGSRDYSGGSDGVRPFATPPALPEDDESMKIVGKTQDTVEAIMKVKHLFLMHELNSTGYESPAIEYAYTFENLTRGMDEDLKESIINGKDSRLTAKVLQAVANRKLAMLRQKKAAHLQMEEYEMEEKIQELMHSKKQGLAIEKASPKTQQTAQMGSLSSKERPKQHSENITYIANRLYLTEPEFKRKITYIVVNGSSWEKEALKERFNSILSSEDRNLGNELAKKIKTNRLNYTIIRMMMKMKTDIRQVLLSQK